MDSAFSLKYEQAHFAINQGLEATLSDPRKKYQDKVNALLSSWEHVASLISAVSEDSCTSLIQWAIRHTLVLVLQGGWPNLSPAIKTHLNVTLQRCSVLLGHHKDAILCKYLMSLVSDPWGHKVLRREHAEIDEVIEFCKAEEEFLSVRLEILCDSKCEDIALQISQTCFKGLWTIKAQLVDKGLTLFQSLTDFYLALLYKRNRVDLMLHELHYLDLQDGLSVIKRCTLVWSQKSQRIWKNSGKIAIILANFFMTKAMVTGGVLFLDFLKEWALLQSNNYSDLEKLSEDVRKLIQSAPSAIQIYSFSEILVKQFGDRLKSLCIELYIRALTTDMNELEQQKSKKDKDKVRETEIRLSNGFLQLAELAKEVVGISRECILTAFSLNPIQSIYEKLKEIAIACGKYTPKKEQPSYDKLSELSKACDKISPQQQKILERDKEMPIKPSNQNKKQNDYTFNEYHPWNTFNQITGIDSKNINTSTSESCPIHNSNHYPKNNCIPTLEQCTCSSNMSSQIKSENIDTQNLPKENSIQELNNYDVFSAPNKVLDDAEKLGLNPQLCDDLAVVLSNPRYHVLSWILEWRELSSLCEKYLVNSEEMRNLNKELKYLNIDYTQFKNLPTVNDYFGIEKGYEKWAEDDQDSSSSDYKRPRPRKFKLEQEDSNGSNSSFTASYTHRSRSRSNGRDPTRKKEKNRKTFWKVISDSESTTQDSSRTDSVCGDDFTNETSAQKDANKQNSSKNISHFLYNLDSKHLTNDLNSIMIFSQMSENVTNSDSVEFKQSLNYLLKSNNNIKRNPDRLRNLRMYRRENCSPISQSNCKILGSSLKQDLKYDFAPRLSTLNLNPRIVLTRADVTREHQKNNIFTTSTIKNNETNYKISTTSTTSSSTSTTTTTTSTTTTTTTTTTTLTSSISTTTASSNNLNQVHNKMINKVNQKNLYTSDNFYTKNKYRQLLQFDKSRFNLSHPKTKMNKLDILTKLVIDNNILAKSVPGLNSLDMIVPPQSESTVQVVQVTQNPSNDTSADDNHLPSLNQTVPNLNQSVMNNVNTHNISMNNIPMISTNNPTTVSSSSVIQNILTTASTNTNTHTSVNNAEDKSKLNVHNEVKYLTTTSEVSEILRSTLEDNVTPVNVSEVPSKMKPREKPPAKKNESLATQPAPSGNTLPVVKGVDYVIASLINSVTNNESSGSDASAPHPDSSQTMFLYKSDDGKIHIKPIICSPINKNNETNAQSSNSNSTENIDSSQTMKKDSSHFSEPYKDQPDNIPSKITKEASIPTLPKFQHVFGKNIYNQNPTGLREESANSKSNTSEIDDELIPDEIKSNALETNCSSTLQSKAVQTNDQQKIIKKTVQINENISHSEDVNTSTSQDSNYNESKKIQSVNVPNLINSKTTTNIFENKSHLTPIINVKHSQNRHFLSVLGNINIAQKNTSTKTISNVEHQNESNQSSNQNEQLTNQHQTSPILSTHTMPTLNKDSVIRNRMNALLAAALTRPVINTITSSSSTITNNHAESDICVKENSSDEESAKSIPQTVQRITLPVIQKNPRQILRTRIVTPVIQLPNGQLVSRSQMVTLPNRRPASNQQPVLMTPTSSANIPVSTSSRHNETIIPSSETTQLSSTTLEQLREFESVLEQVTNTSQMKERGGTTVPQPSNQVQNNSVVTTVTGSTNTTIIPQQIILPVTSNCNAEFITSVSRAASTYSDTFPSTNTSRVSVTYVTHSSTVQTTTSPVVVVTSYCQSASSPALSVTSQSSSSPCVTPGPSTTVSIGKTPKTSQTKSSKTKTIKTAPTTTASSKASPIPKPQQKPQEDEQTAQRIYAILDEYAEQLRNSPDLNNKPAPRRRSNPPTNPSQSSKRKKSSQTKVKLLGQSSLSCEMSPGTDDPRTMGSEDSSSGIVQLSSVQDSPNPQNSISDEQLSSKIDETSNSVPLNELTEQNLERQQNRLIFADSSRVPGRTVIVQDSLPQSVDNVAVSVAGNTVVTGKSVVVGNTTLPLYLPGSVRQVLLPVPQGLAASVQGRPVVVSKGSKVIRVHQVTVPSNALQMGTTTAGVQGAALVVRQMCVNKPVVPITGTAMSVIGQPTTVKQVKLPLGSLTTQTTLSSNPNQTSILIPTSSQENTTNLANDLNNKQTKETFASVTNSLTNKLVSNNSTFQNISTSLIPDTTSVVSVNVTNNTVSKVLSSTYSEEFNNQEMSESTTQANSLRYSTTNVNQNSSFSSKILECQDESNGSLNVSSNMESVESDINLKSEATSHSKNIPASPSSECSKSLDFSSTPKNVLLSRTSTGINKPIHNFPTNRNMDINNTFSKTSKLNTSVLAESEIQNFKRCNKEQITFNVASTTMEQLKFNTISSSIEKNDLKIKKQYNYLPTKNNIKEEFDNDTLESPKTNIAGIPSSNTKVPWRYNTDLKTLKQISPTHKNPTTESSTIRLEEANIELDDSSLEDMEDRKLLNSFSTNCNRNIKDKSSERFSIFQSKIPRTERGQHLLIQKSLSEECEDLGVDEPSTSDLFPEADILLDINSSPSFEHNIETNSQSTDNYSKFKTNIDDSSSTDDKINKPMNENNFTSLNSQEDNTVINHKSPPNKIAIKSENSYPEENKLKQNVCTSEINYPINEYGKKKYLKVEGKIKNEFQISSSTSLEEQSCSEDNYDGMYDKEDSFREFDVRDESTRISSSSETNNFQWKDYTEQDEKSSRSTLDSNEKQKKFTPQIIKKFKSINDRGKIIFSKDSKTIAEKHFPGKRSAESSSLELTKKIKSSSVNKVEETTGTSYETDLEKDYKEAIQFVAKLRSKSLEPPDIEKKKTFSKNIRSRQGKCNESNESLYKIQDSLSLKRGGNKMNAADQSTKQIIDQFDFEISSEDSRPFSPYNSYINEKELRNSESNISNLFDDAISYPSEDDNTETEKCQINKNGKFHDNKNNEYLANRNVSKCGFDKIYSHKTKQHELKNDMPRISINDFSNIKNQFNCNEKNNTIDKIKNEFPNSSEILSSYNNDKSRNKNSTTTIYSQHNKSPTSSLLIEHENQDNKKSLIKYEDINYNDSSKLNLDLKRVGNPPNLRHDILDYTGHKLKGANQDTIKIAKNEHILHRNNNNQDNKNDDSSTSESEESNHPIKQQDNDEEIEMAKNDFLDLKCKMGKNHNFIKDKTMLNNLEENSIYPTKKLQSEDLSIIYETMTNKKEDMLYFPDNNLRKDFKKGKDLDIIYEGTSVLKPGTHKKPESSHIVDKKDGSSINIKSVHDKPDVLSNDDETESNYLDNLPSISPRNMSTPCSYITQCSKLVKICSKNSPQEDVSHLLSKEKNNINMEFHSSSDLSNNYKFKSIFKNKLNVCRVPQTLHSTECTRSIESQNYTLKIPELEEEKSEENVENNNDEMCNSILSGVKRYKRHQGDTLLPLVEPVQSKFMYTYGKQKHTIRNRKVEEEFNESEKQDNIETHSEQFNINLPNTNGCISEGSSNSYNLTDFENFTNSPDLEGNLSENELINKHTHYLNDNEKEAKIPKNICEKGLNDEYFMNTHEAKGRRASVRDQVRKGCTCCSGSPERPKKKYIKLEKTKKHTHVKPSNNKLTKKR